VKPQRSSLASFVLAALVAAGLSACNTVEGAGKDLQKAGQKIEETARRASQ
jgi:entericidin A